MKVVMVMRDTEYRDAMISMMSESGKDIFIEIAGDGGTHRDSVILTDIRPSEIEGSSLDRIKGRTLFLSPSALGDEHGEDGCRVIFKYSSLYEIMSDLTSIYASFTGSNGVICPSTRLIAVTGEHDLCSASRSRSIARQIIYRHGGSILILPLGYINDYRSPSGGSEGSFRRLMFFIDEGREYPAESFTHTDSYGISYLCIPGCINPLPGLGYDFLSRMIQSIGSHFDTVILDIGTCYSDVNLSLMKISDHVIYFGYGVRIDDPFSFTGGLRRSVRIISSRDQQTEAREIDDFVNDIYGRSEKEDNHT